jgi:O-antigen/teichoic acid export membrane protein
MPRDPVYSNGAALLLSSLVASGLGFVFWLVVARRSSPADLGWGAAVVSLATLAALLGKAGFDASIIRFAPGADAPRLRALLAHAAIASILLTAAVSAVLLALAEARVPSLAPLLDPAAAVGFVALACGTAGVWVLDALFVAEQAAVLVLARNVAFNVAKVAVPLVVAVSAFTVPLAWTVGLAVSVLVAVAFVPRLLRRHRATAGDAPARRSVAAYAAKNYVLNVSEFLPGLVLPVLVLHALGAASNASFYVAWALATVGFLASKAIAQSCFAALSRGASPRGAIGKGARLAALTLGPFAVALVVAPAQILRAFGPLYAAEGAPLVRALAISLLPLTATNLYVSWLKARRAGWELTLLPGVSLAAFLAAAPAALALAGTRGLALAWLLVQTAAGVYALARLLPLLRSETHHEQRFARLHRRPHEG